MIGKPRFEHNKLTLIAKTLDEKNADIIADLTGKLQCEAYGIVNDDACEIAHKYAISDEYVPDAIKCLELSDANQNLITYNDQLRFPVLNGIRRPFNGTLLVDEAQDYSPLIREFVRLFIGPNTTGLILGDPERQALQQFAGADPNTFAILADMLGCETVPLTYNFRCGKSIVANCNDFYPSDMTAAPGAIEGEVGEASMESLDELDNDSAILCEMNSPLLSFVINRISKDKPVQFRAGKLWNLCKSVMWGLFDTRRCPIGEVANRAEEKVREYCGEDGPDANKLEAIKCLSLLENLCIAKGITTTKWRMKTPVHPIEQVIEEISSGNCGPVCMTGHTSKGLQWRDVYHISKPPQPRPNQIDPEWNKHQWRCVGYVIRSRAKEKHFTLTAD